MTSRRALRELALLLCALTACWPLQELVRSHATLLPAAVAVTIVVLAGALCRLRPLSGAVTLVIQLVALACAVGVTLPMRGISPAPGNVRTLFTTLDHILRIAIAPLPPLPCVVLMVILASAGVALVVDYIAGSARMCLFAAVPMLAPFLLSTTAIGRTLPVHYFIVAAAAWTLLLVTQTAANRAHARRSRLSPVVAAVMALAAISASLLVTPLVPHRAAPKLAKGASSGVDATVDFSRSLDLRKSLHSTNAAPVLQYDTTSPYPTPLRVTTSSDYADGVWQASALQGPFTKAHSQTTLPDPGLSPTTPRSSSRTSVTLNGVHPPLVAAPTRIEAANFGPGNGSFRLVKNSGIPILSKPTKAYSVLTEDLAPSARPSTDDLVTTRTPTVTTDDLDTSTLPPSAREGIRNLTSTATRNARTPFDEAVAIQRYLRRGGGFTYSLTVPKVVVHDEELDPLSAFLRTRRGYCTQFATTMIMAARSKGIPARMAIGFLPGKKVAAHYVVRAADAHAWPELYFPGMGWTRFDPTPSSRSGAAPSYAPDAAPKASSSSRPSSRPRTTPSATSHPTSPRHRPSHYSHGEARFATLMKAALLIVLVALGFAVLPLAGRAERGRVLKDARTDAERVEGHWHTMQWTLADLAMNLPSKRSPQEALATFRATHPDRSPELEEAVRRAVEAVEDSRYAATSRHAMGPASAHVITAARQEASIWQRCRALIAPSSGVEFFRRLLRRR